VSAVHHRTATVDGRQLFYREAGDPTAPAVLLLHGYPTSSFMFRALIPRLADRYHVIAPDHLGFGLSDAPPVTDFRYTFDALAKLTAILLDQLGVSRYAMYVQDYGAPIGWRLALADPEAVTAIMTQNGNGYEEGFANLLHWQPIWDYGHDPSHHNEAALRPGLELDAVRWQYLHGEPDPTLVSPDCWFHDLALVSRPGNDLVQLTLFQDYVNNVALYPKLHDYLLKSRVPVLAVWGRNDEIFAPAGALAFRRHSLNAEVHLLDGGHFLLESHLDQVAELMLTFLDSRLATSSTDGVDR
jgi:pimeloyl-ACP methyl ester carboxylesterase